ncbi:17619_t:CDS:2 [Cetraspora pellucida]|uniref:17619_t:CDS:1 n=1 Tax=Cetraspora pellucida TaxID=1433469 RepID=A0A9N9DUR4_9GLOM|nr:17619_t:CDS:2 [Cetraspora pellucida]
MNTCQICGRFHNGDGSSKLDGISPIYFYTIPEPIISQNAVDLLKQVSNDPSLQSTYEEIEEINKNWQKFKEDNKKMIAFALNIHSYLNKAYEDLKVSNSIILSDLNEEDDEFEKIFQDQSYKLIKQNLLLSSLNCENIASEFEKFQKHGQISNIIDVIEHSYNLATVYEKIYKAIHCRDLRQLKQKVGNEIDDLKKWKNESIEILNLLDLKIGLEYTKNQLQNLGESKIFSKISDFWTNLSKELRYNENYIKTNITDGELYVKKLAYNNLAKHYSRIGSLDGQQGSKRRAQYLSSTSTMLNNGTGPFVCKVQGIETAQN